MMKILSAAWVILISLALGSWLADAAFPLSFSWKDALPVADSNTGLRGQEATIPPASGMVYVYATFDMGPVNPLKFADGLPQWLEESEQPSAAEMGNPAVSNIFFIHPEPSVKRNADQPQNLQILTVGEKKDGVFTPAVRFGLADDGRARVGMAHVTPWVNDGAIDYFGSFVRPKTPCDFKIRLDLNKGKITVWVSERGDDDWFLLAENVPLVNPVRAIDCMQVLQYPGAPMIRDVRIVTKPISEAETVRPHPLAKKDRIVAPGKGFRFQAMRSTWRKPGKQVTIFRQPGVHAGFPDVAQAGPGHLVCVWRNGSHTGGAGGLSLAHSYDTGKTWGDPVIVTRLNGNCPRIQRLKDGALLLLVDVPESENQFTATWDLVLWDSTDGGKTWTNERWLKTAEVGGGGCIVPSHVCEMADGSWLLASSYFADPKNGGKYVEILDYYRSTDRGKSWQFLSSPCHYPPFCLSEPSPVLLPDGRLMVYARESNQYGMPGAKGYSIDGGKTWQYRELPHIIVGRTCAGLLRDGRMMNTFRAEIGRAALRAWIGDPDDPAISQPAGAHFNDHTSIGLKNGALHIDNDGVRGQCTKYTFRPPDTEKSEVELTAEVKVVSNQGHAATISLPFAGKLRIFPDHIEMAHDPSLRVAVTPGRFHTYYVKTRVGQLRIYVDGALSLETDKGDGRLETLGWTRTSIHTLSFGNETVGNGAALLDAPTSLLNIYPVNITPEVTGYSIWRRVEAVLDDPETGRRELSWRADRDGFPDQYQLDHIIEIEASATGRDQGYSGWTQLDDGRIFVVHYTDDGSSVGRENQDNMGVPWIRGTFLSLGDLPPLKPIERR